MRAKQKFKKGTFSRRVFSVLMALAMVITLMPMNAMEVKAEDATKTQITSMDLNVDWSKIPALTVGRPAPTLLELEYPVTASGTGVHVVLTCEWAVKAPSGEWMPLVDYDNRCIINESDTYAFIIGLAASPGYNFAEESGMNLKGIVAIKSNVNVAQIRSEGTGRTAEAYLELGTVSQIAAAKEEATSTKHTITATAEENGSISPNGAVKVKEGENQTFTITPNAGYEIDTLTVDGAAVTASTSYTFNKVTAAHTIAVTFKQVSSTPEPTPTPDPTPDPTPEVLTNIDIQVDTTKIPTLKVGDPIPNYASQPAEYSIER